MFGPLSRAGTAARRARKKAGLIALVVLVVALVVGEIIDQVVNNESSVTARSDASYVAALVPIVDQSNSLVSLLSEIRGAPSDLVHVPQPRAQLSQLTTELSSGAANAQSAYANLGLEPPTPLSGQLITATLSARARAADLIDEAVLHATGGSVAVAAALLHEVDNEITTSDRSYVAFVRSLPRNAHADVLPTSRWADSGSWSPTADAHFLAALSSSGVLASRVEIGILAIALDPPAVSISGLALPTTTTTTTTTILSTTTTALAGPTGAASSSSSSTLPTTTTTTTTLPVTTTTSQIPPQKTTSNLPETNVVSVTVVIGNNGSVAVPNVVVTATCMPTASPPKKVATYSSATRTLSSVPAGGSRYLDLGQLGVLPGAAYLLTVTATSTGVAPARDEIHINVA